jgi:hypothetical protein
MAGRGALLTSCFGSDLGVHLSAMATTAAMAKAPLLTESGIGNLAGR